MNRINAWWLQRTTREKFFTLLATLTLLINVFYQGIWAPLQSKKIELQQRVQESQLFLQWIEKAQHTILLPQQNTTAKQTIKPSELISFINTSLKQQQLSDQMSHIAQLSEKKIKIEFAAASFDQLILWLAQLQQQSNITAEQLVFSSQESTGKVEASMVLSL